MMSKALTAVITAILFFLSACSSSAPAPHTQDDIPGVQNYARQVLPILESIANDTRLTVETIARSLQKGENNTVFYDQALVLGEIDKLNGKFEQKQKEFEALPVPQGAHDFPASVEDYFKRERTYLDKIRSEFAAGNNQMPLNNWSQLIEGSKLLFYQSRRLTTLANKALNPPQPPAGQNANSNQP